MVGLGMHIYIYIGLGARSEDMNSHKGPPDTKGNGLDYSIDVDKYPEGTG